MFSILDNEDNTEVLGIFHTAVLRRDYELVQQYGRRGFDVNVQTTKGNTGLHFAVKSGDLQMIKLLATFNVYFGILNQEAKTPLYFAIQTGQFEIIKWFISIDPNFQYDFQNEHTLCHIASTYNQKHIIKWMAQESLDIDKPNFNGETPLHYAVKAGSVESIDTLLALGVQLNYSNVHGQTSIHHAAEKDLNILKMLWLKGADIYAKDNCGSNVIHTAAKYGKLDIIKWIEQELDLEMEWLDADGDSPIHYAARNGNLEVLEYFYNKGFPMNIKNIFDETPLFLAAFENHLNVIEYLHEKIGISIKEPDQNGDYLIHIVAIEGHVDLLNWLIEKSVDVQVKDSMKQSPLELAICHKNWNLVRILKHHLTQQDKLELGAAANISYTNKDQAPDKCAILNYGVEEGGEKILTTSYDQTVEDMNVSGEAIEN